MADQFYPIEVQSDFLQRIAGAKPVQALAEIIWNGLDADATSIDVRFDYNALDSMSAIVIRDNGLGIPFVDAPDLFQKLGGSWKKNTVKTQGEGRFLHGQDGRGRFKAFALGRISEWDVTYQKSSELWTFKILMNSDNLRQVLISDETKAPDGKDRGVTVTISELHKDYRAFLTEAGIQELTEIFALYLADYQDVSIMVDIHQIDPVKVIASRHTVNLPDITSGKNYAVRLDIIEWRSTTNRSLYLCNEKGFPLLQVDRRFHIGNFQFSAYLKSEYISKLQKDESLDLAQMTPEVADTIDKAQKAIRDYFRDRAAKEARTVVAEWKEQEIYPYKGEAESHVEQIERQIFDIVAVNIAQYLPDFGTTPLKNKAFQLSLLKQSIERSPEDLQLILEEVLKLPKRKQTELAELLRDVSLSAIISSAKLITDRLKFLTGIETVLFDEVPKKRLKERSQLHQIISRNSWLFGEEFSLSVNDQSLTEVLRKHRQLLGEDVIIDEPVQHISQTRGIIDLMLSRTIRRHRANDLTHLVVELKAPKVTIDRKEVNQIEGYAFSVVKDERFRSVNTTWVFYVIGDDYGDFAEQRILDPMGLIYEKDNVKIYVKTWAQILDENRARLQFFQEQLEYQADKGAALKHLQEHYAEFLEGVLTDEQLGETEQKYQSSSTGLPPVENIPFSPFEEPLQLPPPAP